MLLANGKGVEHAVRLEAKMLELSSYARNKANGFMERAEESQARLENITVILTLSGVVLSVLIAIAAIGLVNKTEKKLREDKNRLQKALDEIKTLQGIIPICSHCKKIRDDSGVWNKIEEYIHTHSDVECSHGVCPDCASKHYSEFYNGNNPGEKKK